MRLSENVINIARRAADQIAKTSDPSMQATIETTINRFLDGDTSVNDAPSFLLSTAILAWEAYQNLLEEESHPGSEEIIEAIEDTLDVPDDLSDDDFDEILETVVDTTLDEEA